MLASLQAVRANLLCVSTFLLGWSVFENCPYISLLRHRYRRILAGIYALVATWSKVKTIFSSRSCLQGRTGCATQRVMKQLDFFVDQNFSHIKTIGWQTIGGKLTIAGASLYTDEPYTDGILFASLSRITWRSLNMTSHYVMTKEKGLLARWRYQYEVTFGLYVCFLCTRPTAANFYRC